MQRLGDYIDQIRGVSYKPADVRDENAGIAILRANNIQDKVDLSDLVYVDENKVSDVQFLKKGDVLICASSGSKNLVGKAVLIPNDMNASFGAFCKVVRIKQISEVNSDFIRMFFLSKNYRNAIAECSIGANINNIKSDHLNGLGINIPNYDIQCSAVDYLTKLKQAIDLKRKQLEDLDELVKSKFQEMFGDVDTNDKGFETVIGKDVFSFSSGKFLSAEKRKEEGIPVYGGNGISWFTDEALIDYPTIIIGRVGAYCGNVKMVNTPVWITDNAIFIKSFKKQMFNIRFLCQLMENASFDKYADVVAQPKITQKPLENYKYIVPDIELQERFADYVKSVDMARKTVGDELVDLGELMDSKMDEYFG